MSGPDKPLVWIQGEIKTPPFSADARIKAGFLLRRLQKGDLLEMPESKRRPSIGKKTVMNFGLKTKIEPGGSFTFRCRGHCHTECVCKEITKNATGNNLCKKRLARFQNLDEDNNDHV